MWRLFHPLRYFRLRNNEKRHLDFWPTVVLAVIIATPFLFLPGASFFGSGGFLDKLILLTSALTGFYVAALVAAATFSHPDLDKVINAGPIFVVTKDMDGEEVKDFLTRREFACTIFGYLAFAALVLSISAILFGSLGNVHRATIAEWRWIGLFFAAPYWAYVRGVVVFGFSLLVAHLAVVTGIGIYYLMDRLHRRDQKVITPKKTDAAA